MPILEVKNVRKVYGSKSGAQTEALRRVTLSVEAGEFIAIMGESGSGKTTLLNIIATLDQATEGQVLIHGKDASTIRDKEIAAFRRNELGFVFQHYNLLESYNGRDNVLLPMVLANKPVREMEERLAVLTAQIGIEALLSKYPYEMSGGQKQRIALARSMVMQPSLLLADEPTGALDSASSSEIMQLLSLLNRAGQTILMVTHSVRTAAYASRVLFIRDGRVYHQVFRGDEGAEDFAESITQSQAMLARDRRA